VCNCAQDRSHAVEVFMVSCFNMHGLRRRAKYDSAPVLQALPLVWRFGVNSTQIT
jgi:hypothetical protein